MEHNHRYRNLLFPRTRNIEFRCSFYNVSVGSLHFNTFIPLVLDLKTYFRQRSSLSPPLFQWGGAQSRIIHVLSNARHIARAQDIGHRSVGCNKGGQKLGRQGRNAWSGSQSMNRALTLWPPCLGAAFIWLSSCSASGVRAARVARVTLSAGSLQWNPIVA